jgi:tetratricopeptide (TPR) repeat protein
MSRSALLLMILCVLSGVGASAAGTAAPLTPERRPPSGLSDDPDGLFPATAALLDASFDDFNRLAFDRAESEAEQAARAQPELPAPYVYLSACLTSRVQEEQCAQRSDAATCARFDRACAEGIRRAEEWGRTRGEARGALYLGTFYGSEGLVRLYQNRLLAAYQDGRKADAQLKRAEALDPTLAEADLGRGQYLYECGRLGGVLRFFLALPGDIPGGIARMERCAREGGRCALLARIVLGRIFTLEEPDFARALPYIQEVLDRYPENWAYVSEALIEAQGLGMGNPAARALVETVGRRWDAGWRPPAYAKIDPGPLRLELACWKDAQGDPSGARDEREALVRDGGPSAAEASRELGLSPGSGR